MAKSELAVAVATARYVLQHIALFYIKLGTAAFQWHVMQHKCAEHMQQHLYFEHMCMNQHLLRTVRDRIQRFLC